MSDDDPEKRSLDPQEVDRAIRAMLKVVSKKPDIKIAIVGGIALQIYGSNRATTDVDFISNWTLGNQSTFTIDRPLSIGGLRYLLEDDIPVDLIVRRDAYKALYDEALDHAVDQGGVPVITADYLTAMKFAAGRQKDFNAVAWLLDREGLVDTANVSKIIERTLGGQVAKDAWEKALSRFTSSLKHFKRPKKS